MPFNHYYQSELSALRQFGKRFAEFSRVLSPLADPVVRTLGVMKALPSSIALSTLGACVPYPHSVTQNPAIEGRVLSAETGLAVSNAKVELDIGSDESWSYETVSDTEGRFVFAEHRDYRLFVLLADAPRCWTTLSVSAPGYRTLRCGWMGMHWCSSEPMKLPRLRLQPEHIAAPDEEMPDNLWRCIESAMEKAN